MYCKFRNNKTTLPFVVSSRSFDHYKDNKDVTYLGTCDEEGNIILPAEQDEAYQKKTLEDHLASVEANMKKKTVVAPNLGDDNELTTDVDDEA